MLAGHIWCLLNCQETFTFCLAPFVQASAQSAYKSAPVKFGGHRFAIVSSDTYLSRTNFLVSASNTLSKSTLICIKKGLQKWMFNPQKMLFPHRLDTIFGNQKPEITISVDNIFKDQRTSITCFENVSFKCKKYTFATLTFAKIVPVHLWSFTCWFLNTELLKISRFEMLQYNPNWTGSGTKCTLPWEGNYVQHPCNKK